MMIWITMMSRHAPMGRPLLSAPVAGRGHDGAHQEPELVCVDQGTSDLRGGTLGLVCWNDAIRFLSVHFC
jgi:hypothetical protein